MYKYKVTQCRNERNSGIASQNEYYDSASASKCTPNIGQASCAGCTSVPGCLFSSQINYDPGRATLGLCSSQADQTYSYRTPASCDASGEANGAVANIWVSIIPLLLIIAYILNAVVVSIVAKKRGSIPKRYLYYSVSAYFFIQATTPAPGFSLPCCIAPHMLPSLHYCNTLLRFNMWTWICLLACTSKQVRVHSLAPLPTFCFVSHPATARALHRGAHNHRRNLHCLRPSTPSLRPRRQCIPLQLPPCRLSSRVIPATTWILARRVQLLAPAAATAPRPP